MERDNVFCPICGYLNENLCLEETDGWMECGKCGSSIQFPGDVKTRKIPVYTLEQIARRVAAGLPL